MPNRNKEKGNRVERAIVDMLKEEGWQAKRAPGSNGNALGKEETVDMLAHDPNGTEYTVQIKGRKSIAKYLYPPDSCDFVIAKGDRKHPLVVMHMKDFMALMQKFLGTPTD